MLGEDDLVKSHKKRAELIGNLIVFAFAIIIARLWYLQIYQGKTFYQYSIQNRLRKEIVNAPRGMIFSRNNEILIQNSLRFDVVVTPQYLKNKKQTLTKLSKILEIPIDLIEKILKHNSGQARYRPVTIKKNLTRREVAIIETENSKMPGVSVQTFISREYTDNEAGAHLFGYISEISKEQLPKYRKRDRYNYRLGDFIGKAGIEEKLDLSLRGEDGHVFMEVDAQGRMKRLVRSNELFKGIENKDAKTGNNIRLTIDRDMQLAAYNALEGKVGSAVAIDVTSGEILTMVSRPAYDPTRFSRGVTSEYYASLLNNENKPFNDRTIQEHYSPGSTFKAISLIAALEEGIVDEDTEVQCPGYFYLGRRKFHCWKKWGHGKVNAVKSLRESCDVYFYKIATKLDIDVIAKYAKFFGLGEKSGISLPREIKGLIPTKEWKLKKSKQEWQLGETLSCIIGQSFVLTTPLQLAMSFAAIANGKTLYRPYLIKEIFNNTGEIVKKPKPEIIKEFEISKKTLDIVKRGLYEVANSPKGTAFWYKGFGLQLAGKTGTSQVVSFSADQLFEKCEEKEYKRRHHAVFTGFAPFENPKVAVGVVVEHGCAGSKGAAPIARDILTAYMKKYQPEKFEKYKEKEKLEYFRFLREREQKRKKIEDLKAQEIPSVDERSET